MSLRWVCGQKSCSEHQILKLLLEASGGGKEDVVQAIRNKVQAAGIDPDRLIVSNRQQNPQYTLYHSIDIVLDPYPCNGGTTTCDALFMSVPGQSER